MFLSISGYKFLFCGSTWQADIMIVYQIAFVCFVIFMTHKLYEACFGRTKKHTRPQGQSTSGRTRPTAPPASSDERATSSTTSQVPSHDPPAYESLYPDLSKLKSAKDASENPSVWSWIFGSGNSSNSFQTIIDKFYTLDEVTDAIRHAGLESSNLLFGKLFQHTMSFYHLIVNIIMYILLS